MEYEERGLSGDLYPTNDFRHISQETNPERDPSVPTTRRITGRTPANGTTTTVQRIKKAMELLGQLKSQDGFGRNAGAKWMPADVISMIRDPEIPEQDRLTGPADAEALEKIRQAIDNSGNATVLELAVHSKIGRLLARAA